MSLEEIKKEQEKQKKLEKDRLEKQRREETEAASIIPILIAIL